MRSWSTYKPVGQNSWINLQDKPAILSDNQINWGEIQGKPTIESITEGVFAPLLTDSNGLVSCVN